MALFIRTCSCETLALCVTIRRPGPLPIQGLLLSFHRTSSDSLLYIGINLITVALESGGRSLCGFPSLAQLVQDSLSRNLFTVSAANCEEVSTEFIHNIWSVSVL